MLQQTYFHDITYLDEYYLQQSLLDALYETLDRRPKSYKVV